MHGWLQDVDKEKASRVMKCQTYVHMLWGELKGGQINRRLWPYCNLLMADLMIPSGQWATGEEMILREGNHWGLFFSPENHVEMPTQAN